VPELSFIDLPYGRLPRFARRGDGTTPPRNEIRLRRTLHQHLPRGRAGTGAFRLRTAIAERSGEADYDTTGSAASSTNLSPRSYREAAYGPSGTPLRDEPEPAGLAGRRNLVREAFIAPPHLRGTRRRREAGASGRRGRGIPRAGVDAGLAVY